MSSYLIISEVSAILRQILWESFESDSIVQPIIGSESAIVMVNPTETAQDSSNRLSLWLYQITEDEFVKNRPMVRGTNGNTSQYPPLTLNFYYLVTPFAPSGESNQIVLGKTLQVLYDNAIIIISDPDNDIAEELRIILCRLTLEELTRIWDALREPYRLSVCYQIRVAEIDSQRIPEHARIIERNAVFGKRGSTIGQKT
jgi:hypothetical protein